MDGQRMQRSILMQSLRVYIFLMKKKKRNQCKLQLQINNVPNPITCFPLFCLSLHKILFNIKLCINTDLCILNPSIISCIWKSKKGWSFHACHLSASLDRTIAFTSSHPHAECLALTQAIVGDVACMHPQQSSFLEATCFILPRWSDLCQVFISPKLDHIIHLPATP